MDGKLRIRWRRVAVTTDDLKASSVARFRASMQELFRYTPTYENGPWVLDSSVEEKIRWMSIGQGTFDNPFYKLLELMAEHGSVEVWIEKETD